MQYTSTIRIGLFTAIFVLGLASCVQTTNPYAKSADPAAVDAPTVIPPPPVILPGQGISGSATVSVVTTTYGGDQSPKNIAALWIEDSNGAFVRTLGVWAATRIKWLSIWGGKQGSFTKPTDADSGATRSNHSVALTKTWDGKNSFNQPMPQGTYRLRGEVTEEHNPGKSFSMDFTVGSTTSTAGAPAAVSGFASVTATYTP